MQIQDVERQTGLDRATIRYYEKENIVVPDRAENGYRSYSQEHLDLLLKVKLLRQLGVSLFKIKCLQQGSEDLSQVLAEQIQILERKIEEDTKAKYVCLEMRRAGVQYSTLDSQYYLDMLSTPLSITPKTSFQEPVPKETHPWRRYFARTLDYVLISVLINVILVTIIRIRPFSQTAFDILGFLAKFAAIPILALLYSRFGTSPGKWVMGIRLENINGGKLSYTDAFYREAGIIWPGLGWFIPLLSQWRMYKAYKEEVAGEPNDWNGDTEIIYVDWTAARKIAAAIISIICLVTATFVAMDTYMPTHRGKGITISQFAQNHRDYERIFDVKSEKALSDEGVWKDDAESNVGYFVIGDPIHFERPEFVFVLDENENVKEITYAHTLTDGDFCSVIPEYCRMAIYTMVGSRPGTTYFDLNKVDQNLAAHLYDPLRYNQGSNQGHFTVRDVQVCWDIKLENCEYINNGLMLSSDESKIYCELFLSIEIIE